MNAIGRITNVIDRVKNADRLTKVRWLIVYCTDIILIIPCIGYVVFYLLLDEGMWWPPVVLGAVALTVFIALGTRPYRIAVSGGPRPTAILVVTGVIAAGLALGFVHVWVLATWLALMTPFVRRRTLLMLIAASLVAIPAYAWLRGVDVGTALPLILTQILFTGVSVGGVWANLWLWRLTEEAYDGQEAMARLAVSEERLRFARDLNDLLGQSLTDVARRTEHAQRTLQTDKEAAAAEMFEVRDLARRSLREVRTVVQNYRAVDLDEVLASVRAVLEAADVRCTVRADTANLTPEARTLLANVVREGATNVLKHSKAERCTITIQDGVLEMSNDGVTGPVGEHAPNGLAGLAQRLRAAGGTLEAAPDQGGRYLLRAAVPA
ncbi:sensor histidine kinase [Nonomuraea sp. NPDC049309]|uniref:sensor histidine kinase n=1 Tax=Nonomuraea sp. NPDC049309 TaxID=3364350 RepID=UPI0037197B4F